MFMSCHGELLRRICSKHQMSKCSCGNLFWYYLLDQLILEAFHFFTLIIVRAIDSLLSGC